MKQTVAGTAREYFLTCGLQLAGVHMRDEVIWLCRGMGGQESEGIWKNMTENFYEIYLREMGVIAPLEEEERNMLLREMTHGNTEARERLVEGSLGQVLELVREYEGRELSMPDIVQEANTALMLAAVEYDGSQDWEALLCRRVKEGVELALKEQRRELAIEENMTARVNVLQTVSQTLARELGREATLEELSAKTKMDQEEVKDIMKLTLDAFTVSGEGQVLSAGEAGSSNPVKDGWSLDGGQ